MTDVRVTGLFPVPLMIVSEALPQRLVDGLLADFAAAPTATNSQSNQLSHTNVVEADATDNFRQVAVTATPHVVEFGKLLFGEALEWIIKEMWMNRLESGGQQSVHSHANSFISGVVYLNETDPSTRTVFYRGMGGRDFVLANEHPGTKTGPYNAQKWAVPQPAPGDMVLFPSYMLHEVPQNAGDTRFSLAFNVVPTRLRSYDYELRLSSERA
ncbi:MAG: putative 2OG-Fe(II) oxygenase [Pseudomonadota bacterium]